MIASPQPQAVAPLLPALPALPWHRWVAFDHCRILLPQFRFAGREDALARLHLLALDDDAPGTAAGPVGQLYTRLLFAGVSVRQLLIFFFRYSGYVHARDGVSRRQQLRDLWHCMWHHNQYARHYYWRKLYQLPSRDRWLDNLEHRQLTTLLRHLNRRLPTAQMTHKHRFYLHCQQHRLPTPDVLAAWDQSGQLLTDPSRPIFTDLFLKPASEFGSVGAQIIPWDETTRTHLFKERALGWNALLTALSHHARDERRDQILQPRMRNATRNAVYGNFDLCNLRIVTALPVDGGEPEAIGAFLRIPSRFTTAGYDRHVLFAHVDLASGRLSTGRMRDITRGEFHYHPETRAPIYGRRIPGWAEMLTQALEAHRTLPWMPFIGWDIVDTDRGIKLLEANAYWGGDAMQAPGAIPLARTRFPEIYLSWFDRLQGNLSAGNIPAAA